MKTTKNAQATTLPSQEELARAEKSACRAWVVARIFCAACLILEVFNVYVKSGKNLENLYNFNGVCALVSLYLFVTLLTPRPAMSFLRVFAWVAAGIFAYLEYNSAGYFHSHGNGFVQWAMLGLLTLKFPTPMTVILGAFTLLLFFPCL